MPLRLPNTTNNNRVMTSPRTRAVRQRAMALFIALHVVLPSGIQSAAAFDTQAPGVQLDPAHYGHYDFLQHREAASTEYSIFDTSFDQGGGTINSTVAASTNDRLQPLTRLETAWSGTAPFTSIAMRLGDSVSHPSTWSQAVRFGGVQIGSLRELPADLVTAPELSAGHAAVPSAADLMTRDLHRVTHINPGGKVTLAVDDVLGRRREINKPLHTAIAILPKGKTEYSLAAGRLREAFAFSDGEYGARFSAATLRYGLRKSVTLDAHAAEVDGVVSVVGAGISKNAGERGKLSASMATSRSDFAVATTTSSPPTHADHEAERDGWLARMGYQIDNEIVELALRARVQSPTYRDLNIDAHSSDQAALHRSALASVTLKLGSMGDVLLAGAMQTFHDATRGDFVSVRHNMSLGPAGQLAASFAYHTHHTAAATAHLLFTHPLGIR